MNIKDAYIHNGLGVLRELQVTAAGMLQLKRAAKDSNDAYVGWEDVYNLTNIKPTNAGTADNVPWTGITGKPETFPVATHDHDDRYLKLAGNTTSTPVTGPIYIDGSGLFIRSKDATKNIWEVVGDGTAWSSNYGFYLQYYGAGSGNNNDLVLYSHGQASTDVEVYRVHQDGSFIFKTTPKVGTSDVYHAGNLSIGTLMGSAAIGDSDEPVYWSGSAFTKCGPFASSSHTHSVKINGTTKTIAAPGDTAVDLGVFMRRISTNPTESYSLKTALTEPAIITTTNGNSYYTDDNGASKNNRSAFIHIPGNSTGHWSQIHIDSGSLKFRSEDHLDWYTVIHSGNIANQSVSSATTATYASNVGAAGTAGTNYVTAAKVIATCNWYDTMTGSDTDTVINRWSEIVDFVANFEETPDLATYLSNNYLAKSGGTMTGQLKWKDSNALPEQTSPQYFLCIDSFTNGGATKWASKANTLKALTGLTTTAIGDADEPVYWDGGKFVKAGAYPTKASWDYDDVYPKKYSYSLPPQKCVKITYSNSAPVLISAGRSNGQAQFLLAGLGYGADGWIRNQFRCLIPSTFFSWKLSDTACTVELYHNTTNSGNAVVTVITTGSITFTETDALSGDADTKRFACYDELTWGNISGKPDSFTPAAHTHYIGTTATQNSSAAQDLTGIKDSTFSGVMNITGKADSYTQGIRIHDAAASGTHAISSIWFRAGAATGFTAGMQGITADSTGMRFRLTASASGTTPTDYLTIAYGGAVTVASKFTASSSVYFTGLSEGTSDPTDGTEILTSYATNNGFADTSGAGQVYRRKASTLYNYIKGKTDNLYVKLSSTEQTIESTISSFSKGIVEFYRSSGDHIAFITFSNKVNNAKRVLGSIGFYSGGVGKLQYRSADAKFYDIVNGSNITTYIVGTTSTTLSTSEQTLLTIKSGESGSLSSTTVKVKLPATDPYTSARTPTAHTHYATTYKDSRNEAMTPATAAAVNGVAIDFKTKANGVNAGSGSYCGVVTLDPYSDTSGGYPLQIGFNSGTDSTNTNEMYIRTVKDSNTWNAWRTVITSSNITTYINDCRNNIVDLRTNPQTFNPSYLKDIVFISEADYTTLVSNGIITKNSITHTYNASNWYVIEDKVPEYAENAGNADYASNAGRASSAESADKVAWSGIQNKPTTATRWPGWSEVTDKPTWVTWSETSSTATYSLSNATWTQTITLPTAAGSYILKLVSGNSTLTGVFSIGASDNAKDEISLHLHGNGPRLYARTNGTKLELSRNVATATNTSVTITYRRMI